jgi:autotransporter-associated beta strand protein
VNLKQRLRVLISLLLAGSMAGAVGKYWKGGTGLWDTSTTNWSLTSGGTVDQVWVDGDSAIIEGTAGTITLAQDISVSNVYLKAGYTVTSNSLVFATNGMLVITNNVNGLVLECGISGEPFVDMVHSGGTPSFAPIAAPMQLGTLYRATDSFMKLTGSVAGNTISEIDNSFGYNVKNAKISVEGVGSWTIQNDSYVGELSMNGGTLFAEGVFTSLRTAQCQWNSGTLHHNVPGVLGSAGLSFNGINLDNSSGSAITTSPGNFAFSLKKDLTFLGSQGADSDLTLGSGAVTLIVSSPTSDNIDVTVSHSASRLTIGGPIGDGGNNYGITKSGAGILQLSGTNTYTGETIVDEGVLDMRVASTLANSEAIQVATNGVLRLENADNSGNPWDFTALSSLNTNIVAGLEPGTASNLIFTENEPGYTDIYAAVPANPESAAYWDGNDTSADADGGSGTWDNSASNWDNAATGGSSVTWDANSTSNDTAVFGGIAGTVDLGTSIDLRVMELNAAYQIGDNAETEALQFNSFSPQINVYAANGNIKAGITGSPGLHHGVGGNFTLEPISASMHLGAVTRGADNYLYLRGDTTTNTIESMPLPTGFGNSNNVKLHKYGNGTWIVENDFYAGEIYVWAGTLISNGRLWENFKNIEIRGGTLTANGTMEGSLLFDSGTLRGTATCYLGVSVPTNGVLAPGNPTGTMTITNNPCIINGTLEINVNGSQYSALTVDPGYALTISNATLNVNVIAPPTDTHLIIARYGSLSGTFAATNGLGNLTIDYNYDSANQIALIPPPKGTLLIIR